MNICLFPNLAYLSETSRAIEIYKALKTLGEPPIVATHGGTYEKILQEEMIPYHIVKPVMTEQRCRDYVLANIGKKPHFYTSEELRDHVENEIVFFRKHEVSLVHIGFTLSVKIAARVLKIPLSTAHGSFIPPVFDKKIAPYRKDFNRGFIRLFPEELKKRCANWIYSHAKIYTKPFNIVAKEFKIAPVQSIADLFLGDYALVTDTPEIIGISKKEIENWENTRDSRYSSPIRLIHVGAIYAKLFGALSQDVSDFLQTEKPKIFVALTSSVENCLSHVYDTLKSMDCHAIFCTTIHPDNFEASENILLKDHIPSHKVMPLCDLVIIHGGQGSIQTAIASGTPIIGFPLQPEQNLNLQLIEDQKAGFNLPFCKLKKEKLSPYIHRILNDSSYASRMKQLKDWQEKYNGPENAARALINAIK
ncbi:glycosyltransferase [Spirochaeta dissipatitropha]